MRHNKHHFNTHVSYTSRQHVNMHDEHKCQFGTEIVRSPTLTTVCVCVRARAYVRVCAFACVCVCACVYISAVLITF